MAEYKDITELKKQISNLKKSISSPNSDYITGYISALSVVEGMIAGLPSVDVAEMGPKWISVEDRFPDTFDDVLVLIKNCPDAKFLVRGKDEYSVGVAWWIGDYWVLECAAYYCGDKMDLQHSVPDKFISHWMPLPEPPKGE